MDPQYGTATLCRFIAGLNILYSKNGKPLSINTIKVDISEIKRENLYKVTESKQKRK